MNKKIDIKTVASNKSDKWVNQRPKINSKSKQAKWCGLPESVGFVITLSTEKSCDFNKWHQMLAEQTARR